MSGTLEQPVRSDRSAASEHWPRFPDADAFCERVAASAFFAEDAPVAVARAPGAGGGPPRAPAAAAGPS